MPFDRFAAQRIRGAILDAVRAADWAPRSVRTLARKLEAVEQRLATELGRVPSSVEMADALGMTRDELSRLQDRMFRSVVLALEHEVNDDTDEDLTLVDVLCDRSSVEPLEELESRELHAYLRDAVSLLPERHRLVIVGYFLEGRTSLELARFLGRHRVAGVPAALGGAGHAQGGHRGAVHRPAGHRAAAQRSGVSPGARPPTRSAIADASGWKNRLAAAESRLSRRLRRLSGSAAERCRRRSPTGCPGTLTRPGAGAAEPCSGRRGWG